MHVVWDGVASQRRLDVGHEPTLGKATSQRQGGWLHLVSQANASGSESGERVTVLGFFSDSEFQIMRKALVLFVIFIFL